MKNLYRHGEIVFVVIDKLPEKLEETKTNCLMKGATGNSHTFKGGKFYQKNVDEFIFGYFEAKDTVLLHSEHGEKSNKKIKEAKLPDGFYELRRGNEIINKEMKQISD